MTMMMIYALTLYCGLLLTVRRTHRVIYVHCELLTLAPPLLFMLQSRH